MLNESQSDIKYASFLKINGNSKKKKESQLHLNYMLSIEIEDIKHLFYVLKNFVLKLVNAFKGRSLGHFNSFSLE